MITSSSNSNLADYYFDLLKNLDSGSKPDLISRLSQSVKDDKQSSEMTLQSMFGACKSDETADEIITAIRASRVFKLLSPIICSW